MGCVGWDMILNGPEGQTMRYFHDKIVLVNDHDGQKAQSCIELSDDGNHGYLTDDMGGAWVLDFARCMIAPHRLSISHHQGDKYLTAFEQPAFRRTQEYARIRGRLIYITFPFCSDEDISGALDDYIRVRRQQLDALYFDV